MTNNRARGAWLRLAPIALLMMSACASLQGSYIDADQQTYTTFHKYIPTWIANDASLDSNTKSDLMDLDYSWGVRVKSGVASVHTSG